MLKIAKFIEAMLLPTIAGICLLISLADLFGVLRFVGDRLPILTLLVLSLVLSSVSFVEHKCTELHRDIHRLLLEVDLEHLRKIVEQVEPNLRKVLDDDYFLDIFNFFHVAVRESKVHVNDEARFRHYFVRTLKLYPKSSFLSVSTSMMAHLWKDPELEEAMCQFIQNGGKIEQLFCLKNVKETASEDAKAVIVDLQKRGFRVSIVSGTSIPSELKKNFIVESKGKVAWETQIDNDGNIITSVVTTNKQATRNYCKLFEKLNGNARHQIALHSYSSVKEN